MNLIDRDALLQKWNNLSSRHKVEFDQVIMDFPTIEISDKKPMTALAVYSWVKDKSMSYQSGHGSCEYTFKRDKPSSEELGRICELLKNQHGYDSVIILNIIPIYD